MPRPAVDEYPARKASWALEHDTLSRRDRAIAQGRLATFAVAVALLILAWRGTTSVWWLVVPGGVFIPLLTRHDHVIRARQSAARLIAFYDRALARISDRWVGTGETGDRFLDEGHLYAADLDLFGRGSLFELLSLARTRAGEETLASWLKRPSSVEVISSRHAAVEELRHALDLRESLSLAGGDIRNAVHSDELTAWAAAPAAALSRSGWIVGLSLALVLPSLVIAWWHTGWLPLLVVAALLRAAYQQAEGARIESILQRADAASRDLDVLRPALDLLERESFTSAPLTGLQAGLRGSQPRASVAIRALVRYVEMHDWAHNIVFTPIAAVLMWNTHLAWAAERWRAAHGAHVADWLRIVGEFEALSSLAAYSYEHPDDPLPTVVNHVPPTGATAMLVGEALGHPLLPAAQMVANDVRLDDATQLLVVSGSNMSGKSTLLRTVGINAVLALAGAPVRAAKLEISPLAIGATLRIQDSLQQGRSRFFAEITRIRDIANVSSTQPLLFLLDELFHGTNSHDRLVGATGVVRSLIDRGAIGLITTHDLALTAITRDLGGRAANVHFEDTFDGTDMHFDYRMKTGPVTRSNAIALMRAVGLDVRENGA